MLTQTPGASGCRPTDPGGHYSALLVGCQASRFNLLSLGMSPNAVAQSGRRPVAQTRKRCPSSPTTSPTSGGWHAVANAVASFVPPGAPPQTRSPDLAGPGPNAQALSKLTNHESHLWWLARRSKRRRLVRAARNTVATRSPRSCRPAPCKRGRPALPSFLADCIDFTPIRVKARPSRIRAWIPRIRFGRVARPVPADR